MEHPIPLTLLAGGPELARLVEQLIDPPGACAVIGGGSADEALAAWVTRTLGESPSPGRILVVLDEHEDAVAAAFTVLSDRALVGLVRLDAVVVTVDAVRLATRLGAAQPVDTAIGLDRLAIADRVLVARSLDVTPQALGAIGHVLRSVNRTGPILAPAISPCSLDDLLDLRSWSGAPTVGPGPARPSPFLGPDTPLTVVCRAERPLDPEVIDAWLDQVVADHAPGLLRIQGAIERADRSGHTFIHGAHSCVLRSHQPGGPEWTCGSSSLLALIGRGLPATSLRTGFEAAQR